MNKKIQILGLGEIVKDWVSVIPWYPKPDEKVDSEREEYFGGGVTANYVVSTTRLGIPSGFIGAVGDDAPGHFLVEDLIQEGVDTKFLQIKKGMSSPVNFIFVIKSTGEKTIIQSPHMQTTKLSQEDLTENMFQGAKLLHTTAIHPELTLKALELAKEEGLMISLDLESQIALRGLKALRPILLNVDVLLPNKMGAMILTKKTTPVEAAREFIQMGVETVVITLGQEGAVAISKNALVKAPAFSVQSIDTTGAGDAFCGGFSFGFMIHKWSLQKSLTFANACAAIKVTQLGARTGMPTLKQAIDFLDSHGFPDFVYS